MKSKYVKIHWRDAVSVDEWTSAADIVSESALIETLGILINETEEIITVALNHDQSNDSYSCFINIPKGWIVQRKVVKA